MQMNNFGSTLIGQTTASRMDGTIMKKRQVLTLFVAVLLTLSAFSSVVFALPLGHFQGLSSTKWTGGTYGANTSVELSNPTLSNTGNFDWGRDIALITSDGKVWAGEGFEKNNSLPVWTHCYGVGLWFWYSYNGENTACFNISQSDPTINHPWFLWIQDDYNSGNPTTSFFWSTFSSYGNTPCESGCHFSTSIPAWYTIKLAEYINNTFTGHNVWGVAWTLNQWETGDGNLHYQTVPSSCKSGGSGCPSAANPPQMYWQVYPSSSNSYGGTLYSCDYDNGTTCTHNG